MGAAPQARLRFVIWLGAGREEKGVWGGNEFPSRPRFFRSFTPRRLLARPKPKGKGGRRRKIIFQLAIDFHSFSISSHSLLCSKINR